ncbi:Protein phosphatase 2C family protein, partial [Perilla frutescens var. frutescens]
LVSIRELEDLSKGFLSNFVTDPNTENRGCDCVAGLECFLNIIRALRMGSCLSGESGSPRAGSPMGLRKRRGSKRRLGSRSSSFDYRREEQLHRTPGRMFLSGSSDIASLFTQQGKKGTNQDAMIVWENFGSRTDTVFCGVFDGHGPFGHLVAKRVRDSLPLKLSAHWEVNIKSDEVLREVSLNTSSMCSEDTSFLSAEEESRNSIDLEETGKQPEIFQTLKESFLKAYKVMDRELRMHASIDCFCSGTTAVTLVKQGQDLVIGNIGDSRAVLATRDANNSLTAVQLTVDLKPNLPAEAERIRKCKGRVFALHDEPEVPRVWLPHNDSPGLAMARAFGDFCLKDFGLISVPEVSYRRITDKDEFIVLATDGIWDVLSNKEVVEIVSSCPSRSYAARALVELAVRAWKTKYPTSKVDDCAVVCLFLDSNESTTASVKSKENIPEAEEDDGPSPTGLNRSGTVREAGDENGEASEANEDEGDEEHATVGVGHEWSALEGVSRVNTLLTLPRFVPGKDDIKALEERNGRK